ncbi:Acetyl esterase/lipase [Sphingomonas gellani]|uniref:Acetyl esterase/lipase n=1 Tax=Sphingomonas gellani TaxID=1166340 RepID=A0A1H7Z1Y8_9SPHN|nr:Acetyl esterase/lipase [Sphingomonas gellani]
MTIDPTDSAQHPLSRRTLVGGVAALAGLATLPASAQIGPRDEVVPLWPGAIPGDRRARIVRSIKDQSHNAGHPDRWVMGVDRPVLVVRRPARANGSAVLLLPGGGYSFLAYDNEGTEQAAWLNARGITAFILLYRLPSEGWDAREHVPLQDAQRAMRVIRADSQRFGVDAARIAVLGFSAGGHLAGSLATRHAEQVYTPSDSADRLPARPDLAGLIYPVVSMEAPFTHGGSRDMLLGNHATPAKRHVASVEARVTAQTPPTFLAHAGDDDIVPVANSLALYSALHAAERPAELHVFDKGGHGFGTRLPDTVDASQWPTLFHRFGISRGVFPA